MASLMTVPTEIRLKIWRYVIPEEVNIPDADLGKLLIALPTNPRQTLLTISKRLRAEVLTLRNPPLCASVTNSSLRNITWQPERKYINAIKRVRVTGRLGMKALPASQWEPYRRWTQRRLQGWLRCRFRAVQMTHSNFEEFTDPDGLIGGRYKVVFDVSDVMY